MDGDKKVRRQCRTASRPYRLEADLYAPVKQFPEALGYKVKGEVRGCDVVAIRHNADGETEPPIVVELKLTFSLGFVLQGIDRLAVTDLVYLAAPTSPARPGSSGREPYSPAHPAVRRLCRRLGLGLLAVHPPAQKDAAARARGAAQGGGDRGQGPARVAPLVEAEKVAGRQALDTMTIDEASQLSVGQPSSKRLLVASSRLEQRHRWRSEAFTARRQPGTVWPERFAAACSKGASRRSSRPPPSNSRGSPRLGSGP
jgi:hypothetical protein